MNNTSAPGTAMATFLVTVLIVTVLVALAPPVVGSSNQICLGEVVTIEGTDRNDELEGTGGPDVISRGAGRDDIRGRGARDRICGGPGPDSLEGNRGRDEMTGGSGRDAMRGRKGRDDLDGGKELTAFMVAGIGIPARAGRSYKVVS